MTVITGVDDLQGLLVISLEQAVAAPYAAHQRDSRPKQ